MNVAASAFCGLAAALALAAAAGPAGAAPSSAVPFVGCARDGQTGPEPAPRHPPTINVAVDRAAAAKLAYYSAGDPSGVLAPRGWHCFGIYGSDGSVLFVTPGPIRSADVMAEHWAAAAGPAVVAAWSIGDTSGRFQVAKAIRRLFPAFASFAQGVIDEDIEPAGDFPSGPFPTDRDVVRSDRVVEYETPAGHDGLGTAFGRLSPGATRIFGVAVLQGATPDLAVLAVRLPAAQQALAPAAVSAFELEAGGPPPAAGLPDVAPAGEATGPLGVVRAFYTALGRGDGATAATLVLPAKRKGAFAPAALTRFYGSLVQPLRLVSARTAGPNLVAVRYTFAAAGGRACNGAANVRTTTSGGQVFIASIEALNGC